jgi:hypothetical protein
VVVSPLPPLVVVSPLPPLVVVSPLPPPPPPSPPAQPASAATPAAPVVARNFRLDAIERRSESPVIKNTDHRQYNSPFEFYIFQSYLYMSLHSAMW